MLSYQNQQYENSTGIKKEAAPAGQPPYIVALLFISPSDGMGNGNQSPAPGSPL
jgi:hypothetical protein